MLLSKRCLYGIRASLFMASMPETRYVPAKEMSAQLGISEHYLPKVLQDLTRAGITRSSRGPHGGIALSRSPEEITLAEIVRAIDGSPHLPECPLHVSGCSADDPCAFCQKWAGAQSDFASLLEETTVADVRLCADHPVRPATPGLPLFHAKKTQSELLP